MNLGQQIKQKRKGKGLTQEQLAKMVGFASKVAVYRIENGKANPSRVSLERIADALECRIEIYLKNKTTK